MLFTCLAFFYPFYLALETLNAKLSWLYSCNLSLVIYLFDIFVFCFNQFFRGINPVIRDLHNSFLSSWLFLKHHKVGISGSNISIGKGFEEYIWFIYVLYWKSGRVPTLQEGNGMENIFNFPWSKNRPIILGNGLSLFSLMFLSWYAIFTSLDFTQSSHDCWQDQDLKMHFKTLTHTLLWSLFLR